jgi:hypothetical protein
MQLSAGKTTEHDLTAHLLSNLTGSRRACSVPCQRDDLGAASSQFAQANSFGVPNATEPSISGTLNHNRFDGSPAFERNDMGFRVKKDRFSIDDVFKNCERGELVKCFGTGTAATVSHVRRLRYKDQTLELPPVEQRTIGLAVRERLIAIMTGKVPDPYA